MAKIDVYLRSIERFGAAGAVLASGQAVTMRFPTGDRHATQVTQHDQLVAIVREVAPPGIVAQLDKQQAARFEIESGGVRYGLAVQPKPGAWQVAIEPAAAAVPTPVPAQPSVRIARAATAPEPPPRPPTEIPDELPIERGQYAGDVGAAPTGATRSGSALLDQL